MDTPRTDFYIVCGEISGDHRAAELVAALQKTHPNATFAGVAGPRLRALNVSSTIHMESFQVMGFIAVLASLPKLIRLFYRILREILKAKPSVVIFVDYPGLNLRLAKALRNRGYQGKIVQYVCPTVWAWGKKRIDLLEKNHDLLLALLPFEANYFPQKHLHVHYVGHPLANLQHTVKWTPPIKRPFLAVFPGSRIKEIEKNLPLQITAALEAKLPFVVSLAQESLRKPVERIVAGQAPIISPQHSKDLIHTCTYAMATSGTICLELALAGVPTVCSYGLSRFDEWLALKVIGLNLPFYCLPNIIAQKEIFPELFGSKLTCDSLIKKLLEVIDGTHACNTAIVKEKLGTIDSATTAAAHIESLT